MYDTSYNTNYYDGYHDRIRLEKEAKANRKREAILKARKIRKAKKPRLDNGTQPAKI